MGETQLRRDANGCYYTVEVPDEVPQPKEEKPKKVEEPPKKSVK